MLSAPLARSLASSSCSEFVEVQFGRLSQSEARFRGFAQTSSDWFWETDEHHRFTYMSPGMNAALGDNRVAYIGHNRIEFAADAESDAAKWEEHLAILNRHEPFREFSYQRKTVDGSEAIASTSGDPFFRPVRSVFGLPWHGARHHKEGTGRTQLARGKGSGGGFQSDQIAIPREYEPRVTHPTQRYHRLLGDVGTRPRWVPATETARVCPPYPPEWRALAQRYQ